MGILIGTGLNWYLVADSRSIFRSEPANSNYWYWYAENRLEKLLKHSHTYSAGTAMKQEPQNSPIQAISAMWKQFLKSRSETKSHNLFLLLGIVNGLIFLGILSFTVFGWELGLALICLIFLFMMFMVL